MKSEVKQPMLQKWKQFRRQSPRGKITNENTQSHENKRFAWRQGRVQHDGKLLKWDGSLLQQTALLQSGKGTKFVRISVQNQWLSDEVQVCVNQTHTCCVSVQVCILQRSIWRPITSQRKLRSFVASQIPRFFARLQKKKEREKMATSCGVDCHFRGRQKS